MSTETKDSIKLLAIVALSICCYYDLSSLDIMAFFSLVIFIFSIINVGVMKLPSILFAYSLFPISVMD